MTPAQFAGIVAEWTQRMTPAQSEIGGKQHHDVRPGIANRHMVEEALRRVGAPAEPPPPLGARMTSHGIGNGVGDDRKREVRQRDGVGRLLLVRAAGRFYIRALRSSSASSRPATSPTR